MFICMKMPFYTKKPPKFFKGTGTRLELAESVTAEKARIVKKKNKFVTKQLYKIKIGQKMFVELVLAR